MGGVGLRQVTEGMVEGDFSDAEGAESVSFSHGELGLVVEASTTPLENCFLAWK